jgi:hypothetical protein
MAKFSKRAQERLAALGAASSASSEKSYHKELNPDGPISLATAENCLLSAELLTVSLQTVVMPKANVKYISNSISVNISICPLSISDIVSLYQVI